MARSWNGLEWIHHQAAAKGIHTVSAVLFRRFGGHHYRAPAYPRRLDAAGCSVRHLSGFVDNMCWQAYLFKEHIYIQRIIDDSKRPISTVSMRISSAMHYHIKHFQPSHQKCLRFVWMCQSELHDIVGFNQAITRHAAIMTLTQRRRQPTQVLFASL